MKVQTFIGKATIDGLKVMDQQINDWLIKNSISLKFINQTFGQERHSQHHLDEPVLLTSVWYE